MDPVTQVIEQATGATVVASQAAAREGDVTWYIARLSDGRWATTDDAELAPDRVNVYATEEEAVSDLWDAWLAAGGDKSPRVCWLLPKPEGR